MTALLLGGQSVLQPVSGVEVVTVLLLTFSYSFGWKRGVPVAVCFSFLRCFLFGFYPYVIVLYLLYFPPFALLFGILGKKRRFSAWIPALLIVGMGAASLVFAVVGVPLDFVGKSVSVMFYILFGIFCALLVLFVLLRLSGKKRAGDELASVVSLAALCTVCFTLLDDVLWPLWGGLSQEAALAYFYNGFLAMLPQTVCAVVSVSLLFFPLRKIFDFAAKKL